MDSEVKKKSFNLGKLMEIGKKGDYVGLDIGREQLKIVEISKKGNKIMIKNQISMPIPEEALQNGELTDFKFVTKSLKIAKQLHNIRTKKMIVSFPCNQLNTRMIQIPVMSEKEVKKTLLFEFEKYMKHVTMEDVKSALSSHEQDSNYIIDYQILGEVETNDGPKYSIIIVTIPKSASQKMVKSVQDAGFDIYAIDLDTLSLSRALSLHLDAENVLAIDIGKEKTDISYFVESVLVYKRNFEFGGNKLTHIISSNLSIPFSEAEEMKIKYGVHNDQNIVYNSCMRSGLSELSNEIYTCITHYKGFSRKPVTKLVLMGGGSSLKGIANFLNQELRIPVEIWNVPSNLEHKDMEIQNETGNVINSAYATGLGLALRDVLPE